MCQLFLGVGRASGYYPSVDRVLDGTQSSSPVLEGITYVFCEITIRCLTGEGAENPTVTPESSIHCKAIWHVPYGQSPLSPSVSIQEVSLHVMGLKPDVRQTYYRVIVPTLFPLDVIDVHDFDITTSLPFCILLFGTPSLNTLWTCQYIYRLKCCRADRGSRKCLLVASRHSIDYPTHISTDAVSVGGRRELA